MELNESAREIEELAAKYATDISGHFSKFTSEHACACGRSRQKREDPFDEMDANYTFYQMSCCQKCISFKLLDNKLCGFELLSLGGSESYHKDKGIDQNGFLKKHSFLLRWDVPISTNLYSFHQFFKKKLNSYRDNVLC